MRIFPFFINVASVLLLLAALSIPVVFVFFGIESTPMLAQNHSLAPTDVTRINKIVEQARGNKQRSVAIRHMEITERDLNLLAAYGLARQDKLQVQVDLEKNVVGISAMYILPKTIFGQYLNLRVLLYQEQGRFFVDNILLGHLSLPGWMVNPMLHFVHARFLENSEDYRSVLDAVHAVNLEDDKLDVIYEWRKELIARLRLKGSQMILSSAQRELLVIYNNRIAEITQLLRYQRVALSQLLRPLFQFAQQRSLAGNDPIAENRALLLITGMYVMGVNLSKVIGDNPSIVQPRGMRLHLLGRNDLMQHFVISAALTVAAGGGIANALGLLKELDDSKGGTGFSFADLLADKAGVRVAEIAVKSPEHAVLLQGRMATIRRDTEFMPPYDHLPEGIAALEFKRRYQHLDSKEYKVVDDEIERRIAAAPVHLM